MMQSTDYGAMESAGPGLLRWSRRPRPTPADDEVLLQVEACGMCGADVSDIARPDASHQRRVPGHEVIGRIIDRGSNVPARLRLGQRVGVGRLGGHCNTCSYCRQGRFALCTDQKVLGVSQDGGYAELMLATSTGLVSIPDELESTAAAPILCAGLATFNALRRCGAAPGDTVAIHGVGGLGHMAIQYARRMGFRVIAVGRGGDIAAAAIELGAHRYLDTNHADAAVELQRLGGAQAIITSVGDAEAVQLLLPGLAAGGTLVVLGVGKTPLSIASGYLVGDERTIQGSMTGSPDDSERALRFSELTDAMPWIECLPLSQAQQGLERLMSGDATFRIVLVPDEQASMWGSLK